MRFFKRDLDGGLDLVGGDGDIDELAEVGVARLAAPVLPRHHQSGGDGGGAIDVAE